MKAVAGREYSFTGQHASRKIIGHGHNGIETASNEAKDCEISCVGSALDVACTSHFHTYVEHFEKPGGFLTRQLA